MMVTTAKVKNARPNAGSRCRSGRNDGWLRRTSAWALLYLFCVGINIDAEAATFVVDSTGDAVDATPGDGVCATSGAVCTLRAAIQESNALAGADTVTVPAGTNTGCPATDQRGFTRPIGASCDVGAYEDGADPLTLIKTAFETDGTPIPTGATIPSPVVFKNMLYINNKEGARSDVSVRDVLDAAFQHQLATIQVDNSVAECALTACTAAEELAIFTAVDGAAFLTDAVDGDVASNTGASTSVDAGNSTEANAQLNINADAVWAILFSVKIP